MKIRVAYDKDKKTGEGTGICVMEGKVAKAGLSGGLSGIRRGGHAVANISLVIISRPRWQDQEKMQLQDRLLRNFAHWFSHALPECLSFIYARKRGGKKKLPEPAAISLLMRRWQDLLEGALGDITASGKLPVDFAVLLFWEEQYLFCGGGDIHILEYSRSRGMSRWLTCEERRGFADMLGETGEIFFKVRNVREHCLFILSPEPIDPEIPKLLMEKNIREGSCQLLHQLPGESSGILLAECIPSVRTSLDRAHLRH